MNNPRPILKLSFDVKPVGHLFEMRNTELRSGCVVVVKRALLVFAADLPHKKQWSGHNFFNNF